LAELEVFGTTFYGLTMSRLEEVSWTLRLIKTEPVLQYPSYG